MSITIVITFPTSRILLNCSPALVRLRIMNDADPVTHVRSRRAVLPGPELTEDIPKPELKSSVATQDPHKVTKASQVSKVQLNETLPASVIETHPYHEAKNNATAVETSKKKADPVVPKAEIGEKAKAKAVVHEEPKKTDLDSNSEKEKNSDEEPVDKSEDVPELPPQSKAVVPVSTCLATSLIPMQKVKSVDGDGFVYSFKFKVLVVDPSHEGLYSVFFHSCPNYGYHTTFAQLTRSNLSMHITERNFDNYLSAGEMPLPELFFALSVVFFILGVIWAQVVKSNRDEAFKIHYLMGTLVFVKSLALFFHGVS